ncbi:hypothetical protein GCK72_019428 [Caenorhabditis remanei]|nr:hypothetical protein GCK72_019428 [Caenorhabditis remanei]KAF1752873.1 hypothetical protein GCK72_019428 [Caenorhabditis remanei]
MADEKKMYLPLPPSESTRSPIRRPRRLNNQEDVDYSSYLEILSSKQPSVPELKRNAEEDNQSGPENKRIRRND